MSSSITIQTRIKTDTQRIAGTKQYYGAQPSILLGGTPYTPAQVVAVYQADIDAEANVATAEAALEEARTAAKAAAATRDGLDKVYKLAIQGTYGSSPTVLGTFGIPVPKRQTPTPAVKAAAAAQAVATRKLRGTTSKKEKATIQAAPMKTTFAPVASDAPPAAAVTVPTPSVQQTKTS